METKQIIDLVNNDLSIKESIGTRKEKTIHQFLKYFISNDSKNHEVHIDKNIVDILKLCAHTAVEKGIIKK